MRTYRVNSSHKEKLTSLFAVGYKKQWKHHADKKRTVASDQTRKERLLADLQEAGYQKATIIDDLCRIESRNFVNKSQTHCPDATAEIQGFIVAIELDGEIHGYGDDISITKKTLERDMDYHRARIPQIVINEALLAALGISHTAYLECNRINLEQTLRARKEVKKENEGGE